MALDKLRGDAPRLGQIAAADSQLPVHHRRIVEDEIFLAAGRAVAIHQLKWRFHQRLGQLLGIRNGRRTADELRLRAIELADPLQPAHHVRQMAAVNAAIIMQFVDHHVAQVLETFRPLGVMRQNAAVQHVRIGQHHVGALANGAARILRRVAVVGERADIRPHGVHRRLKFVKLILGQRLGGKQVHGARARIVDQALEHRQVVAQRLAAGRGRDHHDILARDAVLKSFRLVRVEPRNAARFQRLAQNGRRILRNIGELALARGLMADGADRRIRNCGPLLEARDGGLDASLRARRRVRV